MHLPDYGQNHVTTNASEPSYPILAEHSSQLNPNAPQPPLKHSISL